MPFLIKVARDGLMILIVRAEWPKVARCNRHRVTNASSLLTDPVVWKSVRIGINNCRDVEQPLLIVALLDHRATDAMTKVVYIKLIVAPYTSKYKH